VNDSREKKERDPSPIAKKAFHSTKLSEGFEKEISNKGRNGLGKNFFPAKWVEA